MFAFRCERKLEPTETRTTVRGAMSSCARWLPAMERSNELLVTAFAEALVAERKRAGMTQEDLADRANVSVRFISFLETGKRQPSLSALAAVSAGLGMTMSAMITSAEARYRRLAGPQHGPSKSTS